VNGLLEVDVGNAVLANVVVVDDAELDAGGNRLDEVGGRLDVGLTLDHHLDRLGLLGNLGRGVVRKLRQAELGDVDATLDNVSLVGVGPMGVSLHVGGEASQTKESERLHFGRSQRAARRDEVKEAS
jgi:hypothetical protein